VARAATSGVSLFFVLSGFLITSLLVREATTGRVRLAYFYARRALRLLPALAVCVAAVSVWCRYDRSVSAPSISALYLSNILMGSGHLLGVFSHTWSLSMEEQFYLAWPVVLVVALRRSRRCATATAVVGAVLSVAIAVVLVATDRQGVHWERVRFSPDTRAYGLFIGCALALTVSRISYRSARALAVPAVVACAVASTRTGESAAQYLVWRPLVTIAAAVIIVALLDDTTLISRVVAARPLAYVGKISYALYLWHFPVLAIVAAHLPRVSMGIRAVVAIGLSAVFSVLSYHALELPFLRLRARFRSV